MTLYSPKGYGFDEIYSSPQLTGTRLPTEITFNIPQSPDKWIVGKNSYISIRLNITQTNEAGVQGNLSPIVNTGTRAVPTAISIPFLSVNPAISFFNNASCYVDSNQISQISELQQTNTLYRMLFESKSEQTYVNSQNSIVPPNIDDVKTAVGAINEDYVSLAKIVGVDDDDPTATPATYATTDFSKLFTKHMIWALKNQQFNFDKYSENEITMQVPLPMFYADEPFFVGSGKKLTLRFTVDPLYAHNLIQIAGSPSVQATGAGGVGGGNYQVTTLSYPFQSGAAQNTNVINVAVTDMRLYLSVAHLDKMNIPRSVTIYMKQFSPFVRPLLTGNNNSFTVDLKQYRRMSHIAICFVNKSNEAFHQSPCDFSGGFTSLNNAGALQTTESYINTNQINNLYQVYISFGGNKYPMNDYTLLTTTYGVSTNLARAWYEMIVGSDSLRDRSGSLIDFKTWQASPIFLFKTFQSMETTNNTINVSINCRSVIPNANGTTSQPSYTSNINAFILGLYDEVYSLVFDDQYRVVTESLDAVPIGVNQ